MILGTFLISLLNIPSSLSLGMLYFLLRMVLKKISLFQAYNLVCASTNEISSVGLQVGASPASWKCSEEFFSNQIKSRDPLKLGFVSNIIYFVVISMPFCYFYASYYKYFAHQFFSTMAAGFQIFWLCG